MSIEELLSGESKNVEYKVCRPEKSIKYMKSVVAFANAAGGYLIFGIEDKTREIVGISEEIVFQEMDAITNAISDSCEPVIIPDVYPQTVDGKTVIVVAISAGKQRPYYIKADGVTDGVYMRVSGTSRKANRMMTREMYYESESRSYDSVIRPDLSISDAEIKKLCADMKEVALSNCKNDIQQKAVKDVSKNVLLNWGILAEAEDGSIHPTNAYVFLTGQDAFLSKIQCGMFKGNTRAIFLDKRDYDGPLWKQVEDTFQFVLRNIRLGAKIEGVYRKDIYELPPDSIRELIINAVMNCSFLQSSHVQIAIYDDRLEITSPGGLMPGVTLERMKEGYSQIRNRALAHAFSYMNLIEGWGTGIPRLIRHMEEHNLKEPEFIDMEIALRINLYRNQSERNGMDDQASVLEVPESAGEEPESAGKEPENAGKVPESAGKEPESAEKVPDNVEKVPESAGKVPDTSAYTVQQAMILEHIVSNGQIVSSEVEALLNIKPRRARAILNRMAELGLIAKVGASRRTKYTLPE